MQKAKRIMTKASHCSPVKLSTVFSKYYSPTAKLSFASMKGRTICTGCKNSLLVKQQQNFAEENSYVFSYSLVICIERAMVNTRARFSSSDSTDNSCNITNGI